MVVVIDVPRYNPLLTYNPILQTTTYLSTIVGTFWPTINYQQNQLPTPYQSLIYFNFFLGGVVVCGNFKLRGQKEIQSSGVADSG